MVDACAWSRLRIRRRNTDAAGRKKTEMDGPHLRLKGLHFMIFAIGFYTIGFLCLGGREGTGVKIKNSLRGQ